MMARTLLYHGSRADFGDMKITVSRNLVYGIVYRCDADVDTDLIVKACR